jgi:hypothetical protein
MYTVEPTPGNIKTLMHPVKSAGTSIHAAIIKASNTYNYRVHVNQRHACIRNLPEKYVKYKKYVVIREPISWYRSFYRFFLNVDGYLSWMLNDPLPPDDNGQVFIAPISFEEFVKRSSSIKDTLMKYPNKARVFRNLLRSQSHMHFITGYFESDFSPEDPETMEQFDCSLYEWFMRPLGKDCIFIPMDRLDIIEEEFKIKIPHLNKTDPKKPEVDINSEVSSTVLKTDKFYYDLIQNFNPDNLITINEFINTNTHNTHKEINAT